MASEFECVFETDEQSVPKTVGQEKAAEIAIDWMRASYSIQANTMESLDELQFFKGVQEDKARRLRHTLHELRRMRPDGWSIEFERVQAELIRDVTGIGQTERRIRALVEGETPEVGDA